MKRKGLLKSTEPQHEKHHRYGSPSKVRKRNRKYALLNPSTMLILFGSIMLATFCNIGYFRTTEVHSATVSVQNQDAYTILPRKVFTVVGKESSGTKFVSELLRDALHLHSYREGAREYEFFPRNRETFRSDQESPVQVEHFSLPQGSSCGGDNNITNTVVDVVLPAQCSSRLTLKKIMRKKKKSGGSEDKSNHGENESNQVEEEDMPEQENEEDEKIREDIKRQCFKMTQELSWGFEKPRVVHYPGRYFLDINAHKDWYASHGVEQYIIIVVRDSNMSFKSRVTSHCRNVTVAEQEELVATDIINAAISKYILEEDVSQIQNKVEKLHWNPSSFQRRRPRQMHGRRLSAIENDLNTEISSILPSKNNVILVSYESLMSLQDVYIKMLYKQLGIESDHFPEIRDGNAKYVPRLAEGDEIPDTKRMKKRKARAEQRRKRREILKAKEENTLADTSVSGTEQE